MRRSVTIKNIPSMLCDFNALLRALNIAVTSHLAGKLWEVYYRGKDLEVIVRHQRATKRK